MLYCNGNFIGGLFDEELCFVYADSVSELLGQPEPVYRGYSSTAQHRMLVIPEEHWAKALKLLYAEKFDWSRLVYDITYTSIGAAVVAPARHCWPRLLPARRRCPSSPSPDQSLSRCSSAWVQRACATCSSKIGRASCRERV